MQTKLTVAAGLWAVFGLTCAFSQARGADESSLHGALYGQWRDPKSGDSYRFNRNQTYVFRAGPQESKSGNLSHGGTWSIGEDSKVKFPFYRLQLSATHRQVLTRGKVVTRPADRVFDLSFQRSPLQAPRGVLVYLSKNGRYYYREPDNPRNVHWLSSLAPDPDRLLIEQTAFVRVK